MTKASKLAKKKQKPQEKEKKEEKESKNAQFIEHMAKVRASLLGISNGREKSFWLSIISQKLPGFTSIQDTELTFADAIKFATFCLNQIWEKYNTLSLLNEDNSSVFTPLNDIFAFQFFSEEFKKKFSKLREADQASALLALWRSHGKSFLQKGPLLYSRLQYVGVNTKFGFLLFTYLQRSTTLFQSKTQENSYRLQHSYVQRELLIDICPSDDNSIRSQVLRWTKQIKTIIVDDYEKQVKDLKIEMLKLNKKQISEKSVDELVLNEPKVLPSKLPFVNPAFASIGGYLRDLEEKERLEKTQEQEKTEADYEELQREKFSKMKTVLYSLACK